MCALHRIWCECGVQQQAHVMSFLCTGRCGVSRKRKAVASTKTRRDYAVSAPGRMVEEVGGLVFDRDSCASAVLGFVSHCACPFRACLSATLEFPHHFFSSPGPRNVQCPCKNLFAYSLTFSEFEKQIPSLLFLVQSMPLNMDMKMIPSVNFSGSMFRFSQIIWIC